MITQKHNSWSLSKEHVQLQVIENLATVAPLEGGWLLAEQSPGVDSYWCGFNSSTVTAWRTQVCSLCSAVLCVLAFDFMPNGHKEAAVLQIIES